jgi:hypothetical protein
MEADQRSFLADSGLLSEANKRQAADRACRLSFVFC